jgi:hypothetical protein
VGGRNGRGGARRVVGKEMLRRMDAVGRERVPGRRVYIAVAFGIPVAGG